MLRILLMRAFAIAVIVLGMAAVAPAAETYVEAGIDPSGQLYIVTKRHREIMPKKDADQVAFARAGIAPDGRSVGWLAMYSSPDTTYPLPLKLVVYDDGEQRAFTGTGLPIRRWCFEDGGKQVAFEQETLHGGVDAHYELRDVATGDLVEKFDPDPNADMAARPPRWVVDVNSNP
jgi:hypothetical protein